MKILVVSPIALTDTPQIGGTRTYTLGLLNALRERGDSPVLLGLGKEHPEGKVTLVSLDPRPVVGTLTFLWVLFLRFSKWTRIRPDIVNIQHSLAGLPFCFTRWPFIVTMHGSPFQGVTARRGKLAGYVMHLFEKIVLRRSERVIFVDERAHKRYLQAFPWLAGKAVTIPVGVDTETFLPYSPEWKRAYRLAKDLPPEGPILIFVGRLSPEKNVGGLLSSFVEFRRYHPGAVLLVVGDGPEATTLAEKTSGLEMGQHVRFFRNLSRQEIAHYLGLSDLFVLSSLHEGLPIAALEALACGVPIVATNVGDLGKVIRGRVTGDVVTEVSELAAAMQAAIGEPESPGWACCSASACRSSALQFNWEQICEKIAAQHTMVLKENGRVASR